MGLLLVVDDHLVVALAGDKLAVFEPRRDERDAALRFICIVVLKKGFIYLNIYRLKKLKSEIKREIHAYASFKKQTFI